MTGEQQHSGQTDSLPFGVEIVPPSGFDTGLGRWRVEHNGTDIMIHRTNNTWGNLQIIYGEPKSMRAKVVEEMIKLHTLASAASTQYPHLFERIEILAETRQMLMDRLREQKLSAQEWDDWEESHRHERMYLASEAFDALAPLFEEHGQNPVDIDR